MYGRASNDARLGARHHSTAGQIRAKDRGQAKPAGSRVRTFGVVAAALAMLGTGLINSSGPSVAVQAAPAAVGQGFTVTPSDLAFILKQIKIAERHSRSIQGTQPGQPANPDPINDPQYCSALVGPNPDQIPDYLTSYGLRTVDGGCNNLVPTTLTDGTKNYKIAEADQAFPRLASPAFRDAEPITAAFPVGPPGPTSYAQKLAGNVVVDSQPRVISNLIVDQTSSNPAAVAAAGFPVRTQSATGLVPCDTVPGSNPPADVVPATPAGCTPAYHTLFIPNVTTDVGLSPPYNSLFTFFGQFFDHGVDQTVKSGGTVFVPLHADDPLIAGADHVFGTADDLPAQLRFMVLTRAQNQPGPDGTLGTADDIQNANNTDTPWVDQSQTYTSHPSHQVFLRQYVLNAANHPVATGKLLGPLPALNDADGAATTGAISTWASTKAQARNVLGLLLQDKDVTNIPMIAADPYGKFIPGPLRGLPQYVTTTGTVEGNLASPVAVPANVVHFDTPFLTDIAHNADPSPQDTDNNPATPPVAPTPDADTVASADFGSQPAGTYDDEMLNAHFTCGDGRCNENIALSTIHQIFHHEHDRLVDYIKNTLTTDTSPSGVLALAQWKLAVTASPDGWNGERLFQAARFVTEMEYQHLVFEEFARKMQPAIRPFHVYSPNINAAIPAEFAHAVYRFGHSMLDEDVARTNMDGTDNSTPLLHAFLNPPELFNAHGTCNTPPCSASGTLTPEQGAGAVVMGSSDQTGNELDEFVTDTLRSNLLGLPLDLPTLNMTRARSEGVPPLNDVRRQIFARTNDGQLAPYTSWSDYGQHLKHPESLINFVAAYGTHPSIVSQTTLAGKRAAAKAIVNPAPTDTTPIPADAADFMFSTGAWASAAGVTITGLDDVDLWVGGLAEITNLFGGLLGSTFNYVFETTLENLQDGDRLYYLARTPGMNLRTQLEGNSFAELIMRNTDGTSTLKADAFGTADCKFEIGSIVAPASPGSAIMAGNSVNDDLLSSGCNENKLLLRKADGTTQYRQVNSVNPVGINGQSVYDGTATTDKIFGGNDNDTFWGGDGNDIIEGNGGDDVALGGDGNDIITDLAGADVEKGGPGNDALDGGIGDDIFMGGDGQDFINGGANDNESFAGPGNDYIIAGQGADAVFGDGGDDWIEGGSGQDLLQGDHGAPFFDDPAQVAPGNDIFVGQVGENDYDAEGGDDLMAQNAAIDRNAGAAGFDWAFHQYNTVAADDDMEINNNLLGVPIQVVINRDRWQETEADSGAGFDDVIHGTSVAPSTIGGAGFAGCDALDAAGVARVHGLSALVTSFPSPLAPIVALSAAGYCPLNGGTATGNVWAEGDILIGGTGSDTLEGRGGDDIIDGDRYMNVRISVHNPMDPAVEIGSTDLMEDTALTGNFGPGTAGMTLQQAVFAGLVNPGNLVNVREILTPAVPAPDCGAVTPLNCDTALFSDVAANYTVAIDPAHGDAVTVTDNAGTDGVDTLRNIEQLSFCDVQNAVNKRICDVRSAPVDLATLASVGATLPSVGLSVLSPVFPAALVGAATATQPVVVTNNGGGTVTFGVSSIVGDTASFSADTTGCTTLAAAASCTVNVSFSPASAGALTAQLNITTDATDIQVPLAGTGIGAPTITEVYQPGSARGATITITGTDLATTSSVTIGGVAATFTVVDVNTVTAVVPMTMTPAASVAVTVTTSAGSVTDTTMSIVGPQPTITLLKQSSDVVGAPVIIVGTNLSGATVVFNGTAGGIPAPTLSPSSSIQILTTVPAFAVTGDITVTTANGTATMPFTVTSPTVATPGPTLTGFDPPSGERGTQVLLNGANFTTTTTVSFTKVGGGLAIAAPTLLSSTQIRVTVPATALSGPVLVANSAGSSSLNFDVTFPIVAVSPPVPGAPPAGTPGIPGVSAYQAVDPFRAFDTRVGEPGLIDVAKTRIGGGKVLDVALTGLTGHIPAIGVAAVSLNVTVDNTQGSGFVTVFPCGVMPFVSSLNFVAGQIAANAVIAPVSNTGHVCFYSSVSTDILVDVNGWYAAGVGFNAVAPARVLDTRPGQDGLLNVAKSKIGGGKVLDVRLDNIYGPLTAIAGVSLNVTVDGPVGSGFVTVFPCGDMPLASSVNFVAGQTVANAVIATLSSSGHACFYSNVDTDIVVDVNGTFAAGTGYNSVAPARVLDTRPGQLGMLNVGKTKVGGGNVVDVQLDDIYGGNTAGKVSAVSLNVTVDNAVGSGFVTVFPCGAMPVVSSVNFVAGQIVANAVTATLSSTGHVCFFSSKPTDLIVDVNGYFTKPA